MQHSLPTLEGRIVVRGLAKSVDIVRDAEGVPHIFAQNERDGWFALGYAHAQDRLWQMEFQRRVAQGRLAEILGERAFDVDRLMRTLGLAHWAERIVGHLDADTRLGLEAYAAGVNAFLAEDPTLPLEFHVFGVRPEPWKPADTMGWLLVMSWDLSSNWRSELARMRLIAKIGPERTNEFIAPYPGDTPEPLPDYRPLYTALDATAASLLAAYPDPERAEGSNNWAASGAHTASGKPLLANDPHLGLQAPSLWYLAHVATPAGNLVGATLPGVPFVVLGRNDHLAWSMTTTSSDTEDLFIERVMANDASSYATPDGSAKFEVRDEVIRVGSEERHVKVRSTRHGPVLSDAVLAAEGVAPGCVLALSWAALTEENAVARAGFAMGRAHTMDQFVAALRDFTAPHQNVVFADRDGHIGLVAAARVPVRGLDNEAMGRVPVPGWDAKYDWLGFLSFEEMPRVIDPPGGYIVTANQKITPPGYTPFLGVDWFAPYRSERIEELLGAREKHTVESFAAIQADALSRLARDLLPVARAALPETAAGRAARDAILNWDGRMDEKLRAPLVFAEWYRELTRLVYADELGPLFKDFWDLRGTFMIGVLQERDGLARWCDDITSPPREICSTMSARAFDLAATDLERRYAVNATWGDAHPAAGDHRPLGFVPWIGRFFNVEPPTPGDAYTVDVGSYVIRDELRPFANTHGPSLRAIYDLADLERSRFIQSTGQSGNVFSPWYRSFAERWAKVQSFEIATRREAIAGPRMLTLAP